MKTKLQYKPKTCIEEIQIFIKNRKKPTPGGTIETAVSNVSKFKAGTVSRELRRWSEGDDSLLKKSYFDNPQGGSQCVEYILRAKSK